MPEGDTLYRTATVLREALVGERVTDARGRAGGAQLSRVIDAEVISVRTNGKHLLIEFGNGLTLHTHLQMNGSWHRYHPGERWRLDPDRAVAILETDTAVAVCFDSPTVELLDTRALSVHPVLSRLGPDLLADDWDLDEACARLLAPDRPGTSVAEALLDQRIAAGIGNVYRSEILWSVRVSPFLEVSALDGEDARLILQTARRLLQAGATRGREVHVYRRARLPCHRCSTAIRSELVGTLARRVYWCPTCQDVKAAAGDLVHGATARRSARHRSP